MFSIICYYIYNLWLNLSYSSSTIYDAAYDPILTCKYVTDVIIISICNIFPFS